ncbi:MAG: hypothetical protein RLZZ436_2357, partial [Planctomycetota bacterium]
RQSRCGSSVSFQVSVPLFQEKNLMRSLVMMAAIGLAVATSATTGQAAALNITGNMIGGTDTPPFLANGLFNLSVTFNENGTSTANGSPSTFVAQRDGGGTLNYNKAGAFPLTLTFGKQGTNDTLTIAGTYIIPSSSLQPTFGLLDITYTRPQESAAVLTMSQVNVDRILRPYTTYSGTFKQTADGETIIKQAVLGGEIPVPEPASIGLLAGLGMVCGRRIWRRRQQQQAAAAV